MREDLLETLVPGFLSQITGLALPPGDSGQSSSDCPGVGLVPPSPPAPPAVSFAPVNCLGTAGVCTYRPWLGGRTQTLGLAGLGAFPVSTTYWLRDLAQLTTPLRQGWEYPGPGALGGRWPTDRKAWPWRRLRP